MLGAYARDRGRESSGDVSPLSTMDSSTSERFVVENVPGLRAAVGEGARIVWLESYVKMEILSPNEMTESRSLTLTLDGVSLRNGSDGLCVCKACAVKGVKCKEGCRPGFKEEFLPGTDTGVGAGTGFLTEDLGTARR